MQACHWKAHDTFINFYLKDLTWSDNDNNMYAQVLDPSPQTSHPRKEKKGGGGGGTSATAKSSGVLSKLSLISCSVAKICGSTSHWAGFSLVDGP